MTKMRQAVNRFIMSYQTGDHLGIVSFASFARVKSQLTPIHNDQNRKAMLRHIPKRAQRSTCIGCGIIAALSVNLCLISFCNLIFALKSAHLTT